MLLFSTMFPSRSSSKSAAVITFATFAGVSNATRVTKSTLGTA
jgi:hypothetical protein